MYGNYAVADADRHLLDVAVAQGNLETQPDAVADDDCGNQCAEN